MLIAVLVTMPLSASDHVTASHRLQLLYMAYNLAIPCGLSGGTQVFLLPFAVFALAIYVIGLPVLSLLFLWRHKETVKYDQILRAQLTGDDKSTK